MKLKHILDEIKKNLIHESKLQHGLLKIRSGARKMKIQDINSENMLNEANPADVKRMFAKQMNHANKLIGIIKQSLGYLEKRHKGDPVTLRTCCFFPILKISFQMLNKILTNFRVSNEA